MLYFSAQVKHLKHNLANAYVFMCFCCWLSPEINSFISLANLGKSSGIRNNFLKWIIYCFVGSGCFKFKMSVWTTYTVEFIYTYPACGAVTALHIRVGSHNLGKIINSKLYKKTVKVGKIKVKIIPHRPCHFPYYEKWCLGVGPQFW